MNLHKLYSIFYERYPEIPMIVTSFAWPVGSHVMTMSPGAYHYLLLCAQDWESALGDGGEESPRDVAQRQAGRAN